jgi:hypothetical protein
MTLVTTPLQQWFNRFAKELRVISASCREANSEQQAEGDANS